MKHFFYSILILISFLGCKESPEVNYNKNGFSFTSPKGWELIEEKNSDGETTFLSIEKGGFNNTGLVMIIWVDSNINLDNWLNIYTGNLESNIIYRNSNFSLGDIYDDEFNDMESRAVNFTAKILGFKHEGKLNAFHGNDKTFMILSQTATEDLTKNKNDFDKIESTFIVEELN